MSDLQKVIEEVEQDLAATDLVSLGNRMVALGMSMKSDAEEVQEMFADLDAIIASAQRMKEHLRDALLNDVKTKQAVINNNGGNNGC